eukprot:TRINITY_DN23928_c0_g1_i1.p1 TRINITY_DN23928_c0_g1~~TRINITY_DN23928_c0_g1_i1.p1  ORF type:complete len:330 (-),score=62.93 TRINITY_DN23928_c0_g1_i1:79-972(-)
MKDLVTAGDASEVLRDIDTFIFDMDGVLWRGSGVIEGSRETLDFLRKSGKRCFFLSNNATKSRLQYSKKLADAGFQVAEEEVTCSASLAADYLSSIGFKRKVYVIGEEGIHLELAQRGITSIGLDHKNEYGATMGDVAKLKIDPEIGAVVIGFDTYLNYYKVGYAKRCLDTIPGCLFIATNRDFTFPMDDQILPGGGVMVGCVVTCCAREPYIVGKPNTYALDALRDIHNVDLTRACMVGDRLDTDILFGIEGGVKTLLVLTGVSSREEVEAKDNTIHPNYIAPALSTLLMAQTREE